MKLDLKRCFPVFLVIPVALCCLSARAQESVGTFDEPVFLNVGDKPMNEEGKMMYPSPAVFDVDQDGVDELVIGTIFGGLYSCENSNAAGGDPVWEAPTIVNSIDGEPLELNNW